MKGNHEYTLEEVVGRGSMGTVWRARQLGSDGRVVAVKRVAGGDPRLVERLRREGRVLARLDHPHIVRVFELVPDGDGIAIVMQFAPGGSLADLLEARGRLPAAEAVAVLAPIAEALGSAHRQGVVHRDVKPSNILFTSDGEPLLSDFGIARSARDRPLTAPDVQGLGTAEYLDPAVAAGAAPDARSDVYALGTVCYEVLAGRRPFGGDHALAVLHAAELGGAPALTELVPDLPPALAAAVTRAMARRPADRFPDAGAFAEALRNHPRARPLPRGAHDRPSPFTASRRGQPPGHEAGPAPPDGPGPARAEGQSPLAPGAAGWEDTTDGWRERHALAGQREPGAAGRGSGTEAFGPRPPRGPVPVEPSRPTRVGGRRWALLGLVTVVLLATPVLVVQLVDRGRAAEPAPVGTSAPVCPSPEVPVAAPGEVVLTGDLGGQGCDSWVRWHDGVLEAALEDGDDPVAYELGRPGDIPVLGDWDCDGRSTPGLYRPATGEVFLFDGWAGAEPTEPLRSRPALQSGTIDGTPRRTREHRCDRLEVDPPPA